MTTPRKQSSGKAARALATLALVTLGAGACFTSPVRAADPYDADLEKRVEALEKELNIMENDSKGKNVATSR